MADSSFDVWPALLAAGVRWRSGMRTVAGWRLVEIDGDTYTWHDDYGDLADDPSPGDAWLRKPSYTPDLDDPATRGCLLEELRRVSGDAFAHADGALPDPRLPPVWSVWCEGVEVGDYDTEGEAIIAALCAVLDVDPLLIEATPELLDNWCGPVTVKWSDGTGRPDWETAVRDGQYAFIGWMNLDEIAKAGGAIYLDLRRTECRDRVARVLNGGARPARLGFTKLDGGRLDVGDRSWMPDCWDDGRCYFPEPGVPALADLVDHDDTRLSDGSRLVDALALAAVWREVTK